MQQNDKVSDRNYQEVLSNTQAVGSLLNIPPQDAEHAIWIYYAVMIHNLCNQVLDSNQKISNFKLEIPFIGSLYLEVQNGNIHVNKFEPVTQFIEDIQKAIDSGESMLIKCARKSVGRHINARYKELL